MHDWTSLLLEPATIRSIFTHATPSLAGVDLHEITLHRDGPDATLRFDLAAYPETPPPKWQAQGFNRVQVQLSLSGLSKASIEGWAVRCLIDLHLEKLGSKVQLSGANADVAFIFVADFVQVRKISAYLDGCF